MTEQFFKELFEYNYDCNQKLVALFEKKESSISARAVQVFNHILNAHAVWVSRIRQDKPSFGPWHVHATEELRNLDEDNFSKTMEILQSRDLDGMVEYKNFAGQNFSKSVRDILFHVINHSTYHRGQLAMDFRQTGIEPIPSDYIHYKR